MAIWPFSRAKPTGWVNNNVPTHDQLNKMDEQIAQAADGSLWSDLALVRNWFSLNTDEGVGTDLIGEVLLWEPTLGQWWSFGHRATNVATGYRSYAALNWVSSPLYTDVTATTWTASTAAATNGSGIIVLGGASSTASKIRRSGNAGALWTAENTFATGSESVKSLAYAPSAGLFVAGLSSSVTTNIETSPDGTTWTQRTAPNSHSRQAAAASPTNVVVIADANTNKCISSGDGVLWSERTLPSTDSWRTIAYNTVLNKYLTLGSGGGVAHSVDGITWSSIGLTAPSGASFDFYLGALGRLWVCAKGNQIFVSSDDAATWKVIENFNFGSGFKFAASPGQLLFAEGDGNGHKTRRTLQGGL